MEFLALLRLGKVQKSSILYTVTVWRSLIFVIYLFEKKKIKKIELAIVLLHSNQKYLFIILLKIALEANT